VVVRHRCLVRHRWSRAPRGGSGVVGFVINVWGWTGDERIRDMRVAESGREDDVAETGRKVGVGGVVGRVGVGDVLYVGAGDVLYVGGQGRE
jgi:hypothetical protein